MKPLFWILLFPLSLIAWPIYPFLSKKYRTWRYYARSGPKKYKKTLLTRKPKLDTPERAATFVLENLAQLDFEQVSEIEKAVRKMDSYSVSTQVLYGCRITHPVTKMKNLEKIEARWLQSWYGNGVGIGIALDEREKKWIKACHKSWAPIYLEAIKRNLKNNNSVASVTQHYDPPISLN